LNCAFAMARIDCKLAFSSSTLLRISAAATSASSSCSSAAWIAARPAAISASHAATVISLIALGSSATAPRQFSARSISSSIEYLLWLILHHPSGCVLLQEADERLKSRTYHSRSSGQLRREEFGQARTVSDRACAVPHQSVHGVLPSLYAVRPTVGGAQHRLYDGRPTVHGVGPSVRDMRRSVQGARRSLPDARRTVRSAGPLLRDIRRAEHGGLPRWGAAR